MSPSDVWLQLERVYSGVISVAEFENWLYNSADVQDVLGEGPALGLLEFNYLRPEALRELRSLIDQIYAQLRPAGGPMDTARRVAEDFLAGNLLLHDAARTLAGLWSAGHEWVPTEFVYIDDELDNVPHPKQYPLWEPSALREKLRQWEPMLAEFHRLARAGCEH